VISTRNITRANTAFTQNHPNTVYFYPKTDMMHDATWQKKGIYWQGTETLGSFSPSFNLHEILFFPLPT